MAHSELWVLSRRVIVVAVLVFVGLTASPVVEVACPSLCVACVNVDGVAQGVCWW